MWLLLLSTCLQESGRAGRDGGSAGCIAYYSFGDVKRLRSLIERGAEEHRTPHAQHENNLQALRAMVGTFAHFHSLALLQKKVASQMYQLLHISYNRCNDVISLYVSLPYEHVLFALPLKSACVHGVYTISSSDHFVFLLFPEG